MPQGGGPADLLPTPADLRKEAARARRYARYLAGDEAEQRLTEFADELETRAAEVEKPQE